MSTHGERLARLERIVDVVERIRRAHRDGDGDLATRLNEELDRLLAGDPETLLKTRELADWTFSPPNRRQGDALAAEALDELRDAILSLGPSPSRH